MTLRKIPIQRLELINRSEKFAGGFGSICKAKLLVDSGPRLGVNSIHMYKRIVSGLSVEERPFFERHLNELADRLLFDDGGHLESRLASPKALITDLKGQVLGFLMPEFANGCYFEKRYTFGPARPAQRLLSDFLNFGAEQKRLGVPSLELIDRLDYTVDFWKSLALLHERNILVGDISPYNLILQDTSARANRRRVIFVDVDSFLIASKAPWRTPVSTLNWRVPEDGTSVTSVPTPGSDVYKGTLFTLRLLHHAFESSSTSFSLRNPGSAKAFFENNSAKKMSSLVSQGLRENPKARPSAREIAFELREFRQRYVARETHV